MWTPTSSFFLGGMCESSMPFLKWSVSPNVVLDGALESCVLCPRCSWPYLLQRPFLHAEQCSGSAFQSVTSCLPFCCGRPAVSCTHQSMHQGLADTLSSLQGAVGCWRAHSDTDGCAHRWGLPEAFSLAILLPDHSHPDHTVLIPTTSQEVFKSGSGSPHIGSCPSRLGWLLHK